MSKSHLFARESGFFSRKRTALLPLTPRSPGPVLCSVLRSAFPQRSSVAVHVRAGLAGGDAEGRSPAASPRPVTSGPAASLCCALGGLEKTLMLSGLRAGDEAWGRGLGTRASTVPPQEGSSRLPRFALPGNRATSYAEIRRGAGVQAQQPLMPASVPGPGGGCPRSLGLPGRPWHEAAAPTTGSWTRDCRVRYHPPGLPCCSAVMVPSSILCHSHTVILVALQEKIHVHLSGLIRCYLVKFIQTKY